MVTDAIVRDRLMEPELGGSALMRFGLSVGRASDEEPALSNPTRQKTNVEAAIVIVGKSSPHTSLADAG